MQTAGSGMERRDRADFGGPKTRPDQARSLAPDDHYAGRAGKSYVWSAWGATRAGCVAFW